jgi:hypothetical protein
MEDREGGRPPGTPTQRGSDIIFRLPSDPINLIPHGQGYGKEGFRVPCPLHTILFSIMALYPNLSNLTQKSRSTLF